MGISVSSRRLKMSSLFDIKYDYDNLDRPLMWVLSPKSKDANSMLNMKALVGSTLATLDRVFLGSLGQGLDLDGTEEQYKMFKKSSELKTETVQITSILEKVIDSQTNHDIGGHSNIVSPLSSK